MARAAKRRLNHEHRHELFKLAVRLLKPVKEMEKERKMRDQLGAEIVSRWEKFIEPNLKILKASVGGTSIKDIWFGNYSYRFEYAEHELPNGEKVGRWSRIGISNINNSGEALKNLCETYHTASWRRILTNYHKGVLFNAATHFLSSENPVKLSRKIWIPGLIYNDFFLNVDRAVDNKKPHDKPGAYLAYSKSRYGSKESPSSEWLCCRKIYDLTIASLEASHERWKKQKELLGAIIDVLQNTSTFEELVKIWPEAKQIEKTLFVPVEKKKKPQNALIVLSDTQKQLLCQNMRDRKAGESLLCAA